uniref:Pre-mRNA-splicing factor 18 n=1 Tax=Rhabditophanes sp. KR3021 TaxID=114890 RepID=A0AC35UH62_9BILA
MDFLKEEIERKRKQVDELTAGTKKKYFVRRDLTKANLPAEVNEIEEQIDGKDNIVELPKEEIYKRLRIFKVPVALFGETLTDQSKRLKDLEKDLLTKSHVIQKEYDLAVKGIIKIGQYEDMAALEEANKYDIVYKDGANLKWEDICKDAKELGVGEDTDRNCKIVGDFIKYMLYRWASELNNRTAQEKLTFEGKHEASRHKETVLHIKSLIRDLDTKRIKNDIKCHLSVITRFAIVDKDYIQANAAYMEMAIGNAPWPVGITRSGIHQRPASSRMYVKNIAHVLNDENQRKYIQAFKRLISLCQSYFPTDPSKMINYVRE